MNEFNEQHEFRLTGVGFMTLIVEMSEMYMRLIGIENLIELPLPQ
jgi:hypothetical protein